MPGKVAGHVQTSQAHGLGVKGKEHRDDAPPFIQWPVFMRQTSDGKIAPHKVLWPAFWGEMIAGSIKPLPPDVVRQAAGDALVSGDLKRWKPLSTEQVRKILKSLAANKNVLFRPAFVTGGKAYTLEEDGSLFGGRFAPAAPYAWPIGHNVRPKTQSLGSVGCTDCHASDSAIFFGQVQPDSMIESEAPAAVAMYEFLGKDPTELRAWGTSYQFRPYFKIAAFAAAGLMAAVLVLYGFRGLLALLRRASR